MRPASKRILKAALDGLSSQNSISAKNYSCDKSKLPPELANCFVKLEADHDTVAFLTESKRKSYNVCLQFLYATVQFILCLFLSQTSINGLLERGHMFIFSKDHLKRLFPQRLGAPLLLDIGSGDGHVTDQLLSLGARIHVTETSHVMQRTLRRKGYEVLDANNWARGLYTYDIISCLNVLDRSDSPLSMLKQMHSKLASDGLLLLAVVMPFEPFVENGARQVDPKESLHVPGESWEEGVSSLWNNVLQPLGFTPVALSRLPYICEGDFQHEFYSLDDAILLLRR